MYWSNDFPTLMVLLALVSVFSSHNFTGLHYWVNERDFRLDLTGFSALSHLSSPKSPGELRSLLAFLQYYSQFIPCFSTVAQQFLIFCHRNHLLGLLQTKI